MEGLSRRLREISIVDDRPGAEHQRALDHVLQPRTLPGHGVPRSTAIASAETEHSRLSSFAMLVQQPSDQRFQIVGAFAKRRDAHLDDVDPIQQIFAEACVSDAAPSNHDAWR